MEKPNLFERELISCIEEAFIAYKNNPNPKSRKEKDDLYEHFKNLRYKIGDFRFIEYKSLNDNILAGIYFSKKIIEDIWENLAADSSFGYENVIVSNNYDSLQRNLFFYLNSIINNRELQGLQYMIKTVKAYQLLLLEIEEKIGRGKIEI